jgi:ketosteroid isomerase-like protein
MALSTYTAIRDAIVAANERLMGAFSRRDAAGVAAAYTANGQVLPPNSDVIVGQQGSRCSGRMPCTWGSRQSSWRPLKWRAVAIRPTGEGGQVLDTGKYVVIWQQESGQWQRHRDIWNSSRPAPRQ